MIESVSIPFPTVERLALECGHKWDAFDKAADNTRLGEAALQQALRSLNQTGGLESDSALVLFGSFARREMTGESDYDWTLLIDGVVDNAHARRSLMMQKALADSALIEPGSSGTFGNLVFSHDLVHHIGGGADSNTNLTRRMLMLLESRPFDWDDSGSGQLVWDNVLNNILERYFEQEVHFSPAGSSRVPRFLLNDLTRYWRTICVDYAAKHREQDGNKWALRNAKLRFSRKLIYASGLAFCLSCELDPPQEDFGLFDKQTAADSKPFIAAAKRFAMTPSLEFLAQFIAAYVTDETRRKKIAALVFGSYNAWLEKISDKDFRCSLKELSHTNAADSADFQTVREESRKFASGLQLLFFGRESDPDPISNLCLDYVGF